MSWCHLLKIALYSVYQLIWGKKFLFSLEAKKRAENDLLGSYQPCRPPRITKPRTKIENIKLWILQFHRAKIMGLLGVSSLVLSCVMNEKGLSGKSQVFSEAKISYLILVRISFFFNHTRCTFDRIRQLRQPQFFIAINLSGTTF